MPPAAYNGNLMMPRMRISLARELRFGVLGEELPAAEANNFAANPALDSIAPLVCLTAAIDGPVHPKSGMLINIKQIDRTLRAVAAPMIADACRTGLARGSYSATPDMLPRLLASLGRSLMPHRLVCLRLVISPWLYQEIYAEETPMIRMTQRFEFSAAHRLHSPALDECENRELFGKCNNPNGHGHNYEMEVTIGGRPDPATGLIIPIRLFQKLVNERTIAKFDHKHLNLDCPEFAGVNPTLENIAQIIFQKLGGAFKEPARLVSVRVWETPKTSCEVRAEDESGTT